MTLRHNLPDVPPKDKDGSVKENIEEADSITSLPFAGRETTAFLFLFVMIHCEYP